MTSVRSSVNADTTTGEPVAFACLNASDSLSRPPSAVGTGVGVGAGSASATETWPQPSANARQDTVTATRTRALVNMTRSPLFG